LIINIVIIVCVTVEVQIDARRSGSILQTLNSSSNCENTSGICTGYHDFVLLAGVGVTTGEQSLVAWAPMSAVVADDETSCGVESKWHTIYN
jgi:hypothetical protein